jgi:protein-disulfide isomerase
MIHRLLPVLLIASVPVASGAAVKAPVKAAAKAPAKAPAAADWLQTYGQTADGAVVIGNPNAKVKLVEYLSLTCPHCAHLAGEALTPLKRDYIAKGLVSLEIRHAVRDGYDFVGSLLSRCAPRRAYLDSIETLFASQQQWMDKAMAVSSAGDFDSKSQQEKMAFVSHGAGFDAFFAKRGMTAQRYSQCMADKAAIAQLEAMTDKSWNADKIPGTPAFRINGEMVGTLGSWAELQAKIKAALG